MREDNDLMNFAAGYCVYGTAAQTGDRKEILLLAPVCAAQAAPRHSAMLRACPHPVN
jgi:hypothetical protein